MSVAPAAMTTGSPMKHKILFLSLLYALWSMLLPPFRSIHPTSATILMRMNDVKIFIQSFITSGVSPNASPSLLAKSVLTMKLPISTAMLNLAIRPIMPVNRLITMSLTAPNTASTEPNRILPAVSPTAPTPMVVVCK